MTQWKEYSREVIHRLFGKYSFLRKVYAKNRCVTKRLCHEFAVATERRPFHLSASRRPSVELLGTGQQSVADILRLPFAHHVDRLDASEGYTGTAHGFESIIGQIRRSVVLLTSVVQIGIMPDVDWFQLAS